MEPRIVVHGGTRSPPSWSDGCEAGARAGADVLRRGGSAMEAVLAAVRVLEDDGRFNAGRGSVLRLDGRTVETDAGVMDSEGRLGAVAGLRGFRHPIDVARAVADTPHVLFVGEGAARLGAARGLAPWTDPPSAEALDRHRRSLEALAAGTTERPGWRGADLPALWNFPSPLPQSLRPHDTVGAVARDERGSFATANSTGGAVPMLLGRAGDSPVPGAGFWAGDAGAVAATGVGEEIVRRLASHAVYRRLEAGAGPAQALAEVVALFPEEASFGACVVAADEHAVLANRPMAFAVL